MNRFASLTCAIALSLIFTQSTSQVQAAIKHSVSIPTLNVRGKNAPEFRKSVRSIKPECLNSPKLCPGDRNR